MRRERVRRIAARLELDPNLGDARVNLGRLLHEGGDPKAAVSHYRRALEGTGDDHVTHYNLALALEDIHEQQAALAHYHRALELNPDFADAHFNLGRLLERTGAGSASPSALDGVPTPDGIRIESGAVHSA